MELNIAEILKDKPKGTKLYTPIFGEVKYDSVLLGDIKVLYSCTDRHFYTNGKFCMNGECLLFPSKEMRDWSKFAWKKGDVLVSNNGSEVLFEKFNNDEYTEFTGRYVIELGDTIYSDAGLLKTSVFKALHDGDKVKDYIAVVEKLFGGKLNRETLEIEKPHPEFKDGDIISITPQIGNNLIFIFRRKDDEKYYCHAYLDGNIAIVNDDSYCQKDFCTVRPSTEEEQKQLFEALAEKGKAWDAEKKQIVDLKPKWTPKPFDRCIWKIRNCEGSIWQASFVSYVDEYGATPIGMSIDEDLVNLIILPYNDQTKLLVGTTYEWKGGEK